MSSGNKRKKELEEAESKERQQSKKRYKQWKSPEEKNEIRREQNKVRQQRARDKKKAAKTCESGINEYSSLKINLIAHTKFIKDFDGNDFGHVCDICDSLCFKNDLKSFQNSNKTSNIELIRKSLENADLAEIKICSKCFKLIKNNRVPLYSVCNGFKYPPLLEELKNNSLDLVTERFISPIIPFVQIRRLRRSKFGIYGQIINVPTEEDTMVRLLPRNIDDHSITIHIKRKTIQEPNKNYDKKKAKIWLRHLENSPLYTFQNIMIDSTFLNSQDDEQDEIICDDDDDGDSECLNNTTTNYKSLIAHQQTLMWNNEMYLRIAPGENNVPNYALFHKYAEELSFPQIYLGTLREFPEKLNVTPLMMAKSELKRSDRRGVTPQHLIYMAMKIMRIKLRDSLSYIFVNVVRDTITKEQIESAGYEQGCFEKNLAFLRYTIPNSEFYWSSKKADLFAMIRQYGNPTIFFTISANEIGWPKLLQLLYNVKNNKNHISVEEAEALDLIEKCTLVNEDAVTCTVYFNKLVNTLMKILMSKRYNPFGGYPILHYFKRIEFQRRGSPHAHIIAWLENAPKDPLEKGKIKTIELIDFLISVSAAEASDHIKLQKHEHTFTCYKNESSPRMKECRFEAPFMPIKTTMILTPMKETEDKYEIYREKYKSLRKSLEKNKYVDFETYFQANGIEEKDYVDIIRAGIDRTKVFPKREPDEIWNNPFNPFILAVVKSNTDFQFITDVYGCAAYVVKYVSKTKDGASNLQRTIIETMNEHPEFDIIKATKNIGNNLLNHTEITSQEAAWYLLGLPMAKSSTSVVFIPTVWPSERKRVRKTKKDLQKLDANCTDIWKENCFDKYEKRPENLQNITLAQFVSKYTKNKNGAYIERQPKVIRYRNYKTTNITEYKREMVTLHYPFRNEEEDILEKFIKLYDENFETILENRKEFEFKVDIEKIRELCLEEVPDDSKTIEKKHPIQNQFQEVCNDPNAEINDDLMLAKLHKLGAIAKKKESKMSLDDFYDLMRRANEEQREILFHTIHHLISTDESMRKPLLVYLTGPAGSGKTFLINGIMEIYNRFTDDDRINAYIACASTGKAAVAIGGSTVHSALSTRISWSRLSREKISLYRTLFKFVKVVIIDEVSMISADLLESINIRLKHITTLFEKDFGGLDVMLIGDLRQLPPVMGMPIFKQITQRMACETVWRKFEIFELKQVMRQNDIQFISILTKIGNGVCLSDNEIELIEQRFRKKEDAQLQCPEGIRLFYTNVAVKDYNHSILNSEHNKITSFASDVFEGCHSDEQEQFVRQKLIKMRIDQTRGLPSELILVLNRPYMITTNIDVTDGLSNGTIGKLCYVETDENDVIIRVWMKFKKLFGKKRATKSRNHSLRLNLDDDAVPITPQTLSIPLNNNETIKAKRKHFPLISALAMTIHKSQGSTYDHVVYEYDPNHSRDKVYVALTRVTTIQGLYLVTRKNTKESFKFEDNSNSKPPKLQNNTLQPVTKTFLDFISDKKGLLLFSFNCLHLHKHTPDLKNDAIMKKSTVLLLSETRMENEEQLDIPNFNFVVSYKRPGIQEAGVAIYHNTQDTHFMDIQTKFTRNLDGNVSDIGDICVARYNFENGQYILIVVIYISPEKSMRQIQEFLSNNLMIFTRDDSERPMILSGNFNINFANDESLPLIEFLKTLNLNMSNDRKLSTRRNNTTINAVFTRYLHKFQSNIFISYFSDHKPIVSFLEHNEISS